MESGSTKSDAPAVLTPEPELYASAVGFGVGNGEGKDGAGAGGGDMSGGVAAAGTGPGLDYTPFTPALELPAVEYQPAGTRIHTSSWPPTRDGFSWLTYTAFGIYYLYFASASNDLMRERRLHSAGRSGDASGQRAVRRGGAGARGSGSVRTRLVGRAAVGNGQCGGGRPRARGRARGVGSARRLAHPERGAQAQVLHGGELHVAHVADDGRVPVLRERLGRSHHVLRVRLARRRQLYLLSHRLRFRGQERRDALRRRPLKPPL